MMQSKKSVFITSVGVFVLGVLFIIIGQPLKSYIVANICSIKPNSYMFPMWTKSYPLPQEFFLFNWTNPKDIYNASIKPKFQEIGPFEYDVVFKKKNITFNNNNDTVTFRETRTWFYKNGSLDVNVTSLNTLTLMIAHMIRNWSYFAKKGISFSLTAMGTSLSVTTSARKTLFEGYEHPILNVASSIPILAQNLPMDKIGYFYKLNGTSFSGVFNYGTGGKAKFATLYNWNYKNHTDFYPDHCSYLNESLGDFIKVETPPSRIRIFIADFCRIVTMQYVGDEYVEGILGYKFILGDYALDNGTMYPENKCYCIGNCMRSGLFNISACRYNSPIFMSLPHFRHGDPYYVNHIDGMAPNTSHDFTIIIEPTTGFLIKTAATMQANMLLQPIPGISLYQDIPRQYYIPFMWTRYSAQVPSHMVFMTKLFIYMPQISRSIGIFLIIISTVLATIPFIKPRLQQRQKSKQNGYYEEEAAPLKPSLS